MQVKMERNSPGLTIPLFLNSTDYMTVDTVVRRL